MGLDMYLTGRKVMFAPYAQQARLEDDYPIEQIDVRLGYWRKHHNLHDCIVATFAKGIDDCEPIELSKDDLRRIIDAVANGEVPKDETEEDGQTLVTFVKALEWLKQGDPIPEFKPPQTQLGDTLQQIGLTVLEIDETTFPVKDVRYVIYRASW